MNLDRETWPAGDVQLLSQDWRENRRKQARNGEYLERPFWNIRQQLARAGVVSAVRLGCVCVCVCTLMLIRTRTHARTDASRYDYKTAHLRVRACVFVCIRTNLGQEDVCTHTRARAHSCPYTHAYCTHTHAHTRTHTRERIVAVISTRIRPPLTPATVTNSRLIINNR